VTRITGISHADQYPFLIVSRSILLKRKTFQTEVVEKTETDIVCSKTFYFFFFENRDLYEVIWINIVEPDMLQMTIWGMRIACWIPKARNRNSYYVILITFLLQQW